MRNAKRQLTVFVLGSVLLLALLGAGVVRQRLAACKYVPLLAAQLLPNADLATPGDPPSLPAGWQAAAPGVQLGSFAVDGDGRALQLLGIANYAQTPPIPVQPRRDYCFSGRAITDSPLGSATRLQIVFHWLDSTGDTLATDSSAWQPVVLWQPDNPPEHWSPIQAAFRAPAEAAQLALRLHPASDDRVYLDALHVRHGLVATRREQTPAAAPPVAVLPWPDGKRAAVSFSFDWETTMGGLIHSRSVGDPNSDQNPLERGMRMREGVTTTLELFRPHGIRATYYATGYNFLRGNTEQRQFMGNPVYTWASTDNRWRSDRWQTTPWFAPDPYGTVATHPAWYFGDLVPLLQAEQHSIQSHTFSHFYGGFVTADDWQTDLATWREVAAERDVPPADSLAFPWSSSGGMSDASWAALEAAGITAVTRTSNQAQYNLFPETAAGLVTDPRCRPLPGRASMLVCPDFYLTPARADLAIAQIDRAIAQEAGHGMIDLWAHTEEVITPEQRQAWQRVVDYAATHPAVWVAPLPEIAARQQAHTAVRLQQVEPASSEDLAFRLSNAQTMPGLTLHLPFEPTQAEMRDTSGSEQTISYTLTLHERHLIIENPTSAMEVRVWRRTLE